MGRNRLEDDPEYREFERAYMENKAHMGLYDAGAALARQAEVDANLTRRAKLIVDALDAGMSRNAICRAIGITSGSRQVEKIQWAFDYLGQSMKAKREAEDFDF